MTAPTTRETADHAPDSGKMVQTPMHRDAAKATLALSVTADHAELARLAEAATKGEWSIDGYQCVCAPDGQIVADYSCCGRGEWEADAAYILAAQPSRVLALLSEIAALRGERDDYCLRAAQLTGERDALKASLGAAREDDLRHLQKATQAERQRDEAVRLLREVCIIQNNGDLDARIFRAIANQGADQ